MRNKTESNLYIYYPLVESRVVQYPLKIDKFDMAIKLNEILNCKTPKIVPTMMGVGLTFLLLFQFLPLPSADVCLVN